MTARLLRVAFAVGATLAAILAGAWADGVPRAAFAESAVPSRATVANAYPHGSAPGEIRIGDALTVNGQRMQLSAFTTTDSPERVVEFYRQSFRERDLIPVAVAQARLGHVSVFDPTDGLQRFVTAVPERSGRTLVLLGVTDPREFAIGRNASGVPYPVPDEHRAFVGYESVDGHVRAQSGQFVSSLPATEVARFYRARLTDRGFVERPESNAGLLAFARGAEQISVGVQSLELARGAAVFVTHIGGEP
jgi:hypothetical protein